MSGGPAVDGRGLGIVIPTFREAECIGPLLRAVLEQTPNARIVVVDDTPDRSTVDAAEVVGSSNVQVVHRAEKGGRGSAVLEGLRLLRDAACIRFVEMDADFSHPPGELRDLVRQAEEGGFDLLIASRYLPQSEIRNWPFARLLFSRASNRLARLVLGVPVADYTNGFRAYSARAVDTILDTCGRLGKGFISLSEILVNLYYRGYKVGERPTVFCNRVRGESSVTLQEVTSALMGLLRISGLARDLRGRRHG